MNKNQKSKGLPPSPRFVNARKPLINLTNMYNNSADITNRPTLHRPSSTKNIRPRISIDECNRPKIKEVHSRKDSRSGSITCSASSLNKQKQKKCKNHPQRPALYCLAEPITNYYCLECSLFLIKKEKQVKKVIKLQKINIQDYKEESQKIGKQKRKLEAHQYIEKCQNTFTDLMKWRHEETQNRKNIYEEFGKMIVEEQIKMEEEIAKIRIVYNQHIKMLENKRQQKIESNKKAEKQAERYTQLLNSNRQDIQNNLNYCIDGFTNSEFKEVMEQYWKTLESAQFFVISNTKLNKDSGIQMTMTVRSSANCKDSKEEQFTFSKSSRFETPLFEKSLKGIKQVNSYGQSGDGVGSESRQSVVDSQFCFQDVNPFIA